MKPEEIKKYEKELRTFANQMLKAYDNMNMLKEFLIVEKFEGQKKEFMQTAQRMKLPKHFFLEHPSKKYDNSFIAGDFVRAIVNGEKNFILRSILESGDIPKHEAKSFSYEEFANVVSKMDNPTDVFIPLDPFFRFVYSGAYKNRQRIKFKIGKEPLILVGDKEIQVHWITSDTNIKEIIVLDKDKIKVIQKTFEQSNIPREVEPIKEFKDYSRGNKLMLYFGEKDNGNFDIILKTVISKPELKEGSAIVINVKNKPEEE